jgi:thiol-disulfide isomerase/thioredoxin
MKRFRSAALIALACGLSAQQPAQQPAKPVEMSQQERKDLDAALADAGTSPIEYLRALQKHLVKYPDSPRRPELEHAATLAAMEANDDKAIQEFGERVLARETGDLQMLDRVTRALLLTGAKDTSERALQYARRYEELIRQVRAGPPRGGLTPADWQSQADRGLARALGYEAHASGNLGRGQEALALAQRAFETSPNAEAAREVARCFERLNQPEDAARAFADAFTIQDPKTTDAERARDRGRMGELYVKAKGSETGLGDLVLQAYDRNLALLHARELRLKAFDPNAQLTNPMEFTLGGVDGQKLSMATLKGKVIVIDFWATWCGPCRAQHPLYGEVEKLFPNNSGVVFLSINCDEDRNIVKPFLAEEKWRDTVYFEDGLARALTVASMPTTIVIDKQGKIFTRMNGYLPERFVTTLSDRIREALGN